MTYEEARESFTRKFHKLAPTRHAIKKMVKKFKRTGSVTEEQRTGRPAVANETVQRIQEAAPQHEASISKRFLAQKVKLLGKRHIRFVTLNKSHLQRKF